MSKEYNIIELGPLGRISIGSKAANCLNENQHELNYDLMKNYIKGNEVFVYRKTEKGNWTLNGQVDSIDLVENYKDVVFVTIK